MERDALSYDDRGKGRHMSGKSDRAKDTTGPAEAAPDFDQFAQNMGRLVEEYG